MTNDELRRIVSLAEKAAMPDATHDDKFWYARACESAPALAATLIRVREILSYLPGDIREAERRGNTECVGVELTMAGAHELAKLLGE